MKKLTTTLMLAALTAASLVASEGTSFAATKLGRRPIPRTAATRTVQVKKNKAKEGKKFEESLNASDFGKKLAQHRARSRKGGKHRSAPRGNPAPVIG